MSSRPSSRFAWLAITVLVSPGLSADVLLRWQFHAGEVHPLQLEQEMTSKTSGPADLSLRQKEILDMSWSVKSIARDGSAEIRLRFNRARVDMQVPEVGVMAYDSDKRQKTDDPVFARWEALVGQELSYVMSPRGDVSSLVIPADLREKLRAASGGDTSSEENLRRIAQAFVPFPEHPVTPEAQWKTDAKIRIAPGLDLRLDLGSTYRGTATLSGKEIQKIALKTTFRLERSKKDNPLTFRLLKQEADGGILFDNAIGKPLSFGTRQRMVLEVQTPEGVLEQAIASRARCRFGAEVQRQRPTTESAPQRRPADE